MGGIGHVDSATGTHTGRPTKNQDVDWVVVDRLVRGRYHTVKPNWVELDAAISILIERGYGTLGTARQLGVTDQCVIRHRAHPSHGIADALVMSA